MDNNRGASAGDSQTGTDPEVEAGLLPQVQESGLLLEAFAERVLQERAQASLTTVPGASEPFWKALTREVHALPDAVFHRLPEDAASDDDHYLYGAPKRKA